MSAVRVAIDVITLMTALTQSLEQARKLGALVTKMQAEGRTMPTAEELAELQADDDAVRALESAAIARAKAEGR